MWEYWRYCRSWTEADLPAAPGLVRVFGWVVRIVGFSFEREYRASRFDVSLANAISSELRGSG
jgi:hypothetical protein